MMKTLNEADLSNFKKAFDLFDKDNSGSISKDEIRSVFTDMKIKLNEEQIEKIMNDFDVNNDDSIQFDEFMLVVSAHFEEPDCEEWVFQVFQIMDEDCDGLITKKELMQINKLFHLQIQEKEIDLILEEGDPFVEGGINYQQFSKILKTK